LLYILIKLLPRDDDDSGDEYWLCKCNIRNPELPCEVVARIQFYKSKSIKNFINIAKNSVHLLEIMNKNIYDSKSSYSIHDRAYIYNDGLIVINNVLSVKIKDIRQNRTNVLQYIKKLPSVKSIRWKYHVYQDNFLVCDNFIETKNGDLISFYCPLIFADLKLVISIQIRRINRH
jgi:hypothetical protein